MAEDKTNSPSFFVIILALLVVIAVAYYFSLGPVEQPPAAEETQEQAQTEGETGMEGEEEAETDTASSIDLDNALRDRILGNPDAPVKISEHSSLTCPHCASFHEHTFPKLKAEYIDTGKAYLVFSDFPLNAPAIHATMVGRCIPEENYFSFIETLFAEQDDWAFDVGYLTYLKTKAAENGLDNDEFQDCIQNQELQDGILASMKAAQGQWGINSTPTLVINNRKTVSGAMPFPELSKMLDEAMEDSGDEGEEQPSNEDSDESSGEASSE